VSGSYPNIGEPLAVVGIKKLLGDHFSVYGLGRQTCRST